MFSPVDMSLNVAAGDVETHRLELLMKVRVAARAQYLPEVLDLYAASMGLDKRVQEVDP